MTVSTTSTDPVGRFRSSPVHPAPRRPAWYRPDSGDASPPGPHGRDPDAEHVSLKTVVGLACDSIERCDVASGTIRGGDLDITEASEPSAFDLDRLQSAMRAGPGPRASDTATRVSIDDVDADPRWPSFASQARAHGIGALIAIPLTPARAFPEWSGWLTVYSRQRGPFPAASIALAQTLGLYCSSAINSARNAEHLHAALASRDVIGQAKGILMARRNIDDEQAFAILLQVSQRTNRRLRDIAETVVRSCGRRGNAEPAGGTRPHLAQTPPSARTPSSFA